MPKSLFQTISLISCGIISGTISGFLVVVFEYVLDPLGPVSHYSWNYSLGGLICGFLAAAVHTVVSCYWPSVSNARGSTVFWALFAGVLMLGLSLLGSANGDNPIRVIQSTGIAIIVGAVFGAMLGLLYFLSWYLFRSHDSHEM
ncbi:MAG: hypothetical protein KatS3mg105_2859 [Gemmatales bacterium]|nr:MAG: hypothetical protein KatS3mg105_2859 [Gemmatales bacterium]